MPANEVSYSGRCELLPGVRSSTRLDEASREWCAHFLANRLAAENLPWDDAYTLSNGERRAIRTSIQQFQLGEGSEGRRLLDRGDVYSYAVGDLYFREALLLFIREEQRHSAQLLRFMRRQGIPAVESHWVDTVFRRLRGLAGLELSLRVLVTAEIIAVPYYRALSRTTRSKLLRAISVKILNDEANHLKFQASMLHRLGNRRSPPWKDFISGVQRLFLIGTCCIVWLDHRSVFAGAAYSFRKFLGEVLSELLILNAAVSAGLARICIEVSRGNSEAVILNS
jgi:hypothetical protein